MPTIRMKSGTVKEVSARDAKLLVMLKKATLVQAEPEPAPVLDPEVIEDDEAPKKKYRTKTMKAE